MTATIIAPQDIPNAVVTDDFEVGVVFAEPAVEKSANGDPASVQPKRLRPLVCPVARVTLHSEGYAKFALHVFSPRRTVSPRTGRVNRMNREEPQGRGGVRARGAKSVRTDIMAGWANHPTAHPTRKGRRTTHPNATQRRVFCRRSTAAAR